MDAKTWREALTIVLIGVVSLATAAALLTHSPVGAFATWSLVALLIVAAAVIWLTSVRRRQADRALRNSLNSLRRNATRDPATGLPNRIGLNDDIRYRSAEDPGTPLALIVIDVDRFDSLTRLLGHDRAEDLLETVGSRLRAVAGRDDTVGRIGGDVFTVITSHAGHEEVERRCRIVLEEVAAPMRLSDMDVAVTACAGWITSDDVIDRDDLMVLGIATCEAARAKGRNQVASYTPEIGARSRERRALTDELRVAQLQGQFETYFQPIVELSTGNLAGGEALLRWNHPGRGLIEARRWVDLADEIGLLAKLGRSNLAQCCRHFVALNAARAEAPIQLSVNLSPAELRTPGLAAAVAAATSGAGLDPDLLVVEVGVDALSDDHTVDVLAAIHQIGAHISLDHFGAGIAPLDRITAAGADRVKLDQAIVQDATDGAGSARILRALVDLAHGFDLGVVAEGLLTEPQRDRTAAVGCEFGQGFLYGRPLPFSRFAQLAEDRVREPLAVC